MPIANDPDTRHLNWARVIPGDITLRLQDSYIPDFYRDLSVGGQVFLKPSDPNSPSGPFELEQAQNALVRFVELCGPSLDYLLERAKDLPQLLQIDHAPWELLQYLGSMLGYHWVNTKDAEQQRPQKATPEQIAEAVLGSGDRGIASLADEIRERLGQGG